MNSGIVPKRRLLVYNHYDNAAINHCHCDVSTSPRAMTKRNSGHSRYRPCTTGRCKLYTCWPWNPLQKQPQTRTPMASAKSEVQQTPLNNATESLAGQAE